MAQPRILPHSPEAEKQLLSCCFLDGADIIARCVVAKITPASFYVSANSIIFDVLLDMYSRKLPIDIAPVAEELKTRKLLEQVDGYKYLTEISSAIPTTAQAPYFIEKVREQAVLRDLIRANAGIVEDCYAYTGDMDEFLTGVEAKFIKGLTTHSNTGEEKSIEAICNEIAAEAEDMIAGKVRGDENDLSWGISDLDRYLKKFRRGEMVVLAARPGIGKSSLLRQICAKNVSRDGKNVVVFTLEVTTEEFVRNTAQALSGVNPREIDRYPSEEQQAFIKWAKRLGTFGKTLHVHDINASLANIVAQVRLHHARTPVDMVFIDYLQLINERTLPGENRDQLLGRITRALKLIANELKCVVVILSQLNRASERDDRAPVLADLRESGNIEQDADRVVFIYRPKTKPDGSPQDLNDDTIRFFYSELLQRKGRNVGEHSIAVNFERMAARFLPLVKDNPSQPSPSPAPSKPCPQPPRTERSIHSQETTRYTGGTSAAFGQRLDIPGSGGIEREPDGQKSFSLEPPPAKPSSSSRAE